MLLVTCLGVAAALSVSLPSGAGDGALPGPRGTARGGGRLPQRRVLPGSDYLAPADPHPPLPRAPPAHRHLPGKNGVLQSTGLAPVLNRDRLLGGSPFL